MLSFLGSTVYYDILKTNYLLQVHCFVCFIAPLNFVTFNSLVFDIVDICFIV